jgi:hypothetical protein
MQKEIEIRSYIKSNLYLWCFSFCNEVLWVRSGIMFYCRRIEMAVYYGMHFVMSTFLYPSHHLCVLLTHTLRSNLIFPSLCSLDPLSRVPYLLVVLSFYLHGLSPRANYTDWAAAACRQSDCQLLRIEGATWSAWRIPTDVFLVF